MHRVALVAAVALALAAVWWLWPSSAPRPSPATTAPPAAAPAPVPVTADPGKTPPPAAAAEHRFELQLPDGSYVPALNGAVGAAPLARFWGNWPWSPITGTMRSDAGVDWYTHADGSRSTTEMKWRSDLGRMDAMTRVAHPGPVPGPAAQR